MYTDLNYNYRITSQQVTSTDYDVINNNLQRWFTTPVGTEFFNRLFGTSIYNFLFKTIDMNTIDLIRMQIYSELGTAEPRIQVGSINDIQVLSDPDNSLITIRISYYLVTDLSSEGEFLTSINLI